MARPIQFHQFSFLHESIVPELRIGIGACHVCQEWYYPQSSRRRLAFIGCKVVVSSDENKGVLNQSSKNNIQSLESVSGIRIRRFQESIKSVPVVSFVSTRLRRQSGANIAIVVSIATAILFLFVRMYLGKRRSRSDQSGSVADLVRRGQLRSDRRGISKPLRYDDPFNNPLVNVSKNKSTVEICGKVYRLAQVTLTGEQQTLHQKRRSRAYKWMRPKVFLKEGDPIPPDVDPDSIQWIPANHPFATTSSEIDVDLAQSNMHQKHGVPFRIRAEHDALQQKLTMLQKEHKEDKLVIDIVKAREIEKGEGGSCDGGEVSSSNGDRKLDNCDGGENSSSDSLGDM